MHLGHVSRQLEPVSTWCGPGSRNLGPRSRNLGPRSRRCGPWSMHPGHVSRQLEPVSRQFGTVDHGPDSMDRPRCLRGLCLTVKCLASLQAQLRTFIPLMLKYSTGRGKPGWGKDECRPIWWPEDIPWANVRSDVRIEDDKQKVATP